MFSFVVLNGFLCSHILPCLSFCKLLLLFQFPLLQLSFPELFTHFSLVNLSVYLFHITHLCHSYPLLPFSSRLFLSFYVLFGSLLVQQGFHSYPLLPFSS